MTTGATENPPIGESPGAPLPREFVNREDPFTLPAAQAALPARSPITKAVQPNGDSFRLVSGVDEARAVPRVHPATDIISGLTHHTGAGLALTDDERTWNSAASTSRRARPW